MIVILIRHGKAAKQSPSGRDADRALTERGERQARWLGRTLAGRAEKPGLILTSGIVRAAETARLIREEIGCTLRRERAIETGRSAADALGVIEGLEGGPVALVGHNPTMEDLLAALVRGLRGDACEMRTGQGAIVEIGGDGIGRLLAKLRLEEDDD